MTPPEHAPQFLAAAGWAGARIEPLAGDASFRRYFRVIRGDARAVLMDAPPPHEDPRPFLKIAQWLAEAGLVAPQAIATDLDRGLLLIDDLGDDRFKERLDDDPSAEATLYEDAVDLLVHLHRQGPPAGLPPHGLSEWLAEIDLFLDWYLPAVGIDAVDREGWHAAWRAVLEPVSSDGLGPVVVLRDYHAENIMLLDAERAGFARLGLLDFQDALLGHPAYDLVSVLEDARRDVPASLERAMIDRYRAATGEGEAFEKAYWALAAQRNTRILGVFCRLWKRDGKERYTQFQPRMWGLLERDLAHPSLAAVRDWFDANVPPARRSAYWDKVIA